MLEAKEQLQLGSTRRATDKLCASCILLETMNLSVSLIWLGTDAKKQTACIWQCLMITAIFTFDSVNRLCLLNTAIIKTLHGKTER